MILHVSSPGTGSLLLLLLQAMRHPKVSRRRTSSPMSDVSCREDYGVHWREREQVLSLSVVEFMSPPDCLL